MKSALLVIVLGISLNLLQGCVHNAGVRQVAACPDVGAIGTMPFRGQPGIDAAYDSLRFDDACEDKLLESLDNIERMRDPRQAPPDERFVVGDAALFILLERRGLEIEKVVPDDIAVRMQTQGIYAYFDYVMTPSGRASVVSRARTLIGLHQSSH